MTSPATPTNTHTKFMRSILAKQLATMPMKSGFILCVLCASVVKKENGTTWKLPLPSFRRAAGVPGILPTHGPWAFCGANAGGLEGVDLFVT